MMMSHIAEYTLNGCRITRREFDDKGLDFLVDGPDGEAIGVFDSADKAEDATQKWVHTFIDELQQAQDESASQFWAYPNAQWQEEFQAAWLMKNIGRSYFEYGGMMWGIK